MTWKAPETHKPIEHATSWAPTEGQKRADWLMREIRASAEVLGIHLAITAFPIFQQRVFNLMAEEFDHALGSPTERYADHAAVDNLIGAHQEDALNQLSGLESYYDGGPPAELVFPYPTPLKQEGAPVVAPWADAALAQDVFAPSPESAPKKRGRPKGSKGKAKKAKAPKAAKAKPIETYEVLPGVDLTPEALPNGSAEPPAEAPPA